MSSRKSAAGKRTRGPGAGHDERKHARKPKPLAGLSEPQVKSSNAQQREQNKRMNPRNIDQQGNRANVRQNTTRQGNRRSA